MSHGTVVSERASFAVAVTLFENGVEQDPANITNIQWELVDAESGASLATGSAAGPYTSPHYVNVAFLKTYDVPKRKTLHLHTKITYTSVIFGAGAIARPPRPTVIEVEHSPQVA